MHESGKVVLFEEFSPWKVGHWFRFCSFFFIPLIPFLLHSPFDPSFPSSPPILSLPFPFLSFPPPPPILSLPSFPSIPPILSLPSLPSLCPLPPLYYLATPTSLPSLLLPPPFPNQALLTPPSFIRSTSTSSSSSSKSPPTNSPSTFSTLTSLENGEFKRCQFLLIRLNPEKLYPRRTLPSLLFLFPRPLHFSVEVVLTSWGVNRWRGIRDEALDQITGIPGCIFVHAGGFIGGTSLPSYFLLPPFPHLRSRLTSRE